MAAEPALIPPLDPEDELDLPDEPGEVIDLTDQFVNNPRSQSSTNNTDANKTKNAPADQKNKRPSPSSNQPVQDIKPPRQAPPVQVTNGGGKAPTANRPNLEVKAGGKNGMSPESLGRFHDAQKKLNSANGDKKEQLKEMAKEELKDETKQVAKKFAKQAAERASQAVAEAVGEFLLATSEIWVPILLIILGLIVLIFVLYAIYNLVIGGGGSGQPQYASSAQQRQQVSALAALTGNQLADQQLVARTIANEKARLETAKATIQKVYATDSAKAAAATSDLTAIINSMDAVANQPLPDKRKDLIDGIVTQLTTFSNKYPEVLGYGASNGSYLNVPGVMEGSEGECGMASMIMVTLYYNPGYSDSNIYLPASHSVRPDVSSCVTPNYISSNNTVAKDWTWADSKQASVETVKKSLAGGDPVVVYTTPGSVYSNSKHIFVIVGYDPSDDTFFVNNPYPNGVQVHTKTPNSVAMTASHLAQHLGDSIYGHSFMIRKKYL